MLRRTAILLALGAAACNLPAFDPAQIVVTPRVLAVVADPPVVRPGEPVALHALFEDPNGGGRAVTYAWVACLNLEQFGFGGGAQYGMQLLPGCAGGTVIPLQGAAPEATLTGEQTRAIEAGIEALSARFAGQVPPDLLRGLLSTAGLTVQVQVTVSSADGTELIRAFKRFTITTGTLVGTNPPAPRFAFQPPGGADAGAAQQAQWVSGRAPGTADFTCVAEGAMPEVIAGRDVEIVPDPDDAFWRERYLVLNSSGGILEREEDSYYSFYATGGTISESDTQAPTRNAIWKAPPMPGAATFWLVVRDGHGGTSACRTPVRVVAP